MRDILPTLATPAKPKAARTGLVCNECGKKFSVSLNNTDPQCPKCNGVDYEVL